MIAPIALLLLLLAHLTYQRLSYHVGKARKYPLRGRPGPKWEPMLAHKLPPSRSHRPHSRASSSRRSRAMRRGRRGKRQTIERRASRNSSVEQVRDAQMLDSPC